MGLAEVDCFDLGTGTLLGVSFFLGESGARGEQIPQGLGEDDVLGEVLDIDVLEGLLLSAELAGDLGDVCVQVVFDAVRAGAVLAVGHHARLTQRGEGTPADAAVRLLL